MAATPLCEAPLAALKKSLRDEFPDVKSSHLSEALASSMGFRTAAAMQAAMTGPEPDRPYYLLDTAGFLKRLVQLGYPDDPEFEFEVTIAGHDDFLGVVSTMPSSAYGIDYKTPRQRAWRNLLVHAVNAALNRKLFTLRPGDNRFPDSEKSVTFDFALPNGWPARVYVADANFDEIAVHVAVNPHTAYVSAMAGFDAGDIVGMTWVERRTGAWMQSSFKEFHCRQDMLREMASMDAVPQGFGDRGRVIM